MICPYCKSEFYYDPVEDYYDCMNKLCIMYSFKAISGHFLFCGVSPSGGEYTFPININKKYCPNIGNIEYLIKGYVKDNNTCIFNYKDRIKITEFEFISIKLENLSESIEIFENLIKKINKLILYV